MAPVNVEADREGRLTDVLLAYVEAVEREEAPDRVHWARAHPEFARELGDFFAMRDRLERLVAPLRVVSSGSSSVSPLGTLATPELKPGAGFRRVGDFHLLREVGRGGMGVVYEAEQVSLGRRVALKVLPYTAAMDPRHLQRFRTEAHAAAQLHHTHIVPVFAVGAENDVHYYAMQFIDGPSLGQVLTGLRASLRARQLDESPSVPPLPRTHTSTDLTTAHATHRNRYFQRVAEIGWQTADALEHAHQVGIIHRDIKPANLLIDATGRVWVTDFGLAQIRNDAGLTATGEVVGTLRYMSPEQASGRPGLVDHRTDVYSLGATLYELLTLTPLYEGNDARALLREVTDGETRKPRAVDPTIPVALETVILKAMANSPADRYSSARELADDLRRFLDDRPVLARRPTLVDRATKWVRRHRHAAVVAAVGLVLAVLGLGVSTAVIAYEHEQTKAAYERERLANDRERARAAEAEDNHRRARRAVDLFVELGDEELLDFPPLAPLRQRLLEAAVAYYQEMVDTREDPAVREELAASREQLKRFQDELSALNEVNAVLLLDQPAVRADLVLSEEQVSRLTPLLDRVKAQRRAPSAERKGDRRAVLADIATECRQEMKLVLTTAQHRRMQQVNLQLPGPHAFTSAVLDALAFTPTQRADARRILSEATQASLRLVVTAETREDGGAKFAAVWERSNARVRDLFTPTQRVTWANMIGSPVIGGVQLPSPVDTPPRR